MNAQPPSAKISSAAETPFAAPRPIPAPIHRRWLRPILLVLLPALAVLAGLMAWLWGGRYVSTENAYVKADIAQVATEVAGRLIEVGVGDHAKVTAGDVLLRIDADSFRMAHRRAEAELDTARTQVATLVAQWNEAVSEATEAEGKAKYWEAQRDRQRQLTDRGITASSKFEEVDSNADAARDRLAVARAKVMRALAQIGSAPDQPVDAHPLVRHKIAERDRARLDLDRTVVRAPVSGRTVNVKQQVGEHVKAATPLFAIVADNRPWVEANFKETDLTHVKPGLSATVVLDIYPDIEWKAEVASISPATGAEFAILPPQNASGNWVKIVQRLPVRLRLMKRPGEPPLRAGMTASVKIDTERERHLSSFFGFAASATAPATAPNTAPGTAAR